MYAWWCNGSTYDFDSYGPGSNPGRATNIIGFKNDENFDRY